MRRSDVRLWILAGALVLAALALHVFAGDWLSGLFTAIHRGGH